MAPSRPPQPDPLTSTRSATVARLKRLHERKGRQQADGFLAEGPDSVLAAIASGVATEVVVTPDHPLVGELTDSGLPVTFALPRVIDAAADTHTSQGIVAECRLPHTRMVDVLANSGPVVVADHIGDPGNMGTIIRTAEAVGAAGVLVTPGSVDPWNPKAVRASASSIFRTSVASVSAEEGVSLPGQVRASGRVLVALTGQADADVFTLLDELASQGVTSGRLAWIVGSEAHGVSEQLLARCDHRARVPMQPTVESLNAAIALAVCLYAGTRMGR